MEGVDGQDQLHHLQHQLVGGVWLLLPHARPAMPPSLDLCEEVLQELFLPCRPPCPLTVLKVQTEV
jgi:hypothetical protein